MGYTHYWRLNGTKFDANLFSEFSDAVKKVISKAQTDGITIGDLTGDYICPIVDGKTIAFNGYEDEAHESFLITLEGGDDFNFCKTAHKPYDAAVVASLILYKYFFPKVGFSSDGTVAELQEGADLVEAVMGAEVSLSKGDTGTIEVAIGEKPNSEISGVEVDLEIFKHAVSFLSTHVEEASDELDIEIDRKKVKELEAMLYQGSILFDIIV